MDAGNKRPIRVLLAKFELESHDRGFFLVSRMLRDAGMEVLLSIFQDTLQVVNTALQEDVDVIGLSVLSGDTHKVFLPEIAEHMKNKGMDDILLIAGGRILGDDIDLLLGKGVDMIFGPGSRQQEIVDYIKGNAAKKNAGTVG